MKSSSRKKNKIRLPSYLKKKMIYNPFLFCRRGFFHTPCSHHIYSEINPIPANLFSQWLLLFQFDLINLQMANDQQIGYENLKTKLDIDDLNSDPFTQFRYWFNDALKAHPYDASAMILATADSAGRPSARVVLLKGFDKEGFVFFTNYESRKGIQIAENPDAALVFFWHKPERQVRIEGRIEKTSRKESDEYFKIRPEGSKISALISPQSQRIPNREFLEHLEQDHLRLFSNITIDRPDNWGGYRLVPDFFEFWQGRENRLHDRFEYAWTSGRWEIYRLAP